MDSSEQMPFILRMKQIHQTTCYIFLASSWTIEHTPFCGQTPQATFQVASVSLAQAIEKLAQ